MSNFISNYFKWWKKQDVQMQAALKWSQKTKTEEEVKAAKEINIDATVTTVFKIRAGLDFLIKRSPNWLYQVFS